MDNTLKLVGIRRDHGRAILTLSNGETFIMPRSMLKERPYRSGMPFDLDSFREFIAERSYPFAMEKAISLLAMRPRTQQEIVKALNGNAYPEHTIARVMARLDEAGYINDTSFAEQWASSRSARSMGTRRIQMELRQKGVASDTIAHVLSNLDTDDVSAGALKAARKYAAGKNLSDIKDRQKIMAALARRGYDYATAKQALEALRQE